MAVRVETSLGLVEGTEEHGIHVFRGIPYAASTAGSARWRPPASARPWAGVRPALRPGPAAPQQAGLATRMLGGEEQACSEDCLSLNVWTPGPAGPPRPVMVWLHGGGFTTGSGSLAFYDGGALARRGDVVTVTLNYRLGALGFLHLPELAREEGGAAGNFGLLDQLAALAWVRENAAAFGGDPEQVTLFGQSAGAMCAGTLLGVPRARGLFQRAILQSGAASNVHSPETASRVAEVFLEEAGVERSDVARLRELPVAQILEAQRRSFERLRSEIPEPPYQPVVDGKLLPRPPLEAVAEGAAGGIPLLVGTNRDEWRFYGLADPKWRQLDEEGLLRRFRRGLPGVDAQGRCLAERVVQTYRAARSGVRSTDPRDLWFAIQTDRWFRHPAARVSELQSLHEPRTYAYLFTWASPAMGDALGSCHAIEIPFVFGGVGDPRIEALVGRGPAARGLSRRVQDAWLAFARDASPGHAGLPEWPAYAAERRATMVLGEECEVAFAPQERERAFWDDLC